MPESTAPQPVIPMPKSKRGQASVERIMETAGKLFLAKGFDGVTMTEIASGSATAIGSLYRFFATKDAVATAILVRYSQRLSAAMDALLANAETQALDNTVALLVGVQGETEQETRTLAFHLAESNAQCHAQRSHIRTMMLGKMAALLTKLNPALPPAERAIKAELLLQILKSIWALNDPDKSRQALLSQEAQKLVSQYLKA